MASKASKASSWRKRYGDRILDIGKPTEFEHGIHVEYNKQNGKFMVSFSFGLSLQSLFEQYAHHVPVLCTIGIA